MLLSTAEGGKSRKAEVNCLGHKGSRGVWDLLVPEAKCSWCQSMTIPWTLGSFELFNQDSLSHHALLYGAEYFINALLCWCILNTPTPHPTTIFCSQEFSCEMNSSHEWWQTRQSHSSCRTKWALEHPLLQRTNTALDPFMFSKPLIFQSNGQTSRYWWWSPLKLTTS